MRCRLLPDDRDTDTAAVARAEHMTPAELEQMEAVLRRVGWWFIDAERVIKRAVKTTGTGRP